MNESMKKTQDGMMRTSNVRVLSLIGVMTAVTCILGPLTIPIPFSPVPISLTNFAICLSVYALGMVRGTISYLVYLLIGFVGVPVFSAFTGGPARLLGPTGGYLIGFIFLALIGGFFIERWPQKWYLHLIGMVLSAVVYFLFGTGWLAHQADMTFYQALAAGVLPFIPGDLAKFIIAMIVGPQIRRAVNSTVSN